MIEDRVTTEADARCRLIVDAAENALLLVDEHGSIVLANDAAERLLGYFPGTLTGRPAAILDCAEIGAVLRSLRDPSAYSDPLVVLASGITLTARSAGGATVPIQISFRVMDTLRGRQALISIWPREPHPASSTVEKVEVLSLDAPTPAARETGGRWRFDARSGELTWSDEIYRIYGLAPGEPPTFEAALAGYHPADRERILALVDSALRDGAAYRDEARIVRPDGSLRAVVHGGAAERSADGAIIGLSGFFADVTEDRNAERERQRLNEYVMLANQAGKIGVWELDLRTDVSVWDRNMYALYGVDDTTMVPNYARWRALLHPHDRERALRQLKTDISSGAPSDREFRAIWPNGEIHHIRSVVTVVRDASGAPARIIGTDWDITEVRLLAEQLRAEKEALVRSEARYRALTEAMPQMIWVVDGDGQFEYVNQRWVEYTGLSLEGSRQAGLTGVIDATNAPDEGAEGGNAGLQEREFEVRLRHFDGAYRWHQVRSVPFGAAGAAGKWISTATDIEERKAAEKILAATVAELEHIALHDPLTNLPNRTLLTDRLTQAMAMANRTLGGVIVFYLDLDRFKAVNDTYGHAAGDVVLRETGRRIECMLRAGDTASRVGGDEFIVVCTTSGNDDDITHIAARLLAAVTEPIELSGVRFVVEASIGISVYPADGSDADALIRKADAAMYSAKQSGRNALRRYSSETHTSIVAATELEGDLRHAIASNELVVHYQPIIDVRTARPTAAEALVRWQHPRRGLLAPADFIPFAEERGLVAQIGDVVLRSACAMLERLARSGQGDVRIAVNVSAHQFSKLGFVDSIVAALARNATDPRRLTIEITESVVMGNTRAILETLDELRALGVNLSMDDFGTGYSSLAYLKKFPIDMLKIDGSFVRDIADDQTDQAIAKTIVTLAHSLGMSVVAEGVETAEQASKLCSFDADSLQGYLFSRPLPAAEFERFIARSAARTDAADRDPLRAALRQDIA